MTRRTFVFSAPTDAFPVEIAEDCVLTDAVYLSGSTVISLDPASKFNDVFAPAANSEIFNLITVTGGEYSAKPIELRKGEKLFLSIGGAGGVQLRFDTLPTQ